MHFACSRRGVLVMADVRSSEVLVLQDQGESSVFTRVDSKVDPFSEADFQSLLAASPELLLPQAIHEDWAGCVCIARELKTSAGYIDLLLMNQDGSIALVETKLAKNPEIRREVVAQLLDYASSMRDWTFEQLDAAVAASEPLPGASGGIVDRLSGLGLHVADQDRLKARVEDRLGHGRLMLILATERSERRLQNLTEYLSGQNMLFELGLVEVRKYRCHDQVCWHPTLMGRTETVIRRDVVVVADQPSEAVLEMDRPASSSRPSGSRRRPPIDIPQFLDAIRNLHSETFAQEVSGWFDELQSRGFDVVGIPSGIKVTAQVDRLTKPVSIFHLTPDGNVVDFGTLSYHISEKSGLGNAAFETMMHAIANSSSSVRATFEDGKQHRLVRFDVEGHQANLEHFSGCFGDLTGVFESIREQLAVGDC